MPVWYRSSLALGNTDASEDEADTGGEEAGTEAAVEGGEKGVRDAGNVFQADAQRDHKGDQDIAFQAEIGISQGKIGPLQFFPVFIAQLGTL